MRSGREGGCTACAAQPTSSIVLTHAVDEVTALAIDLALDQAVDVGLEAREALVEVACEAQGLIFESDEVCETSYKDRGGKYQGRAA